MAASINLGSIYGALILDTSQWDAGIKKAQQQIGTLEKSTSKSVKNIGGSVKTLGKVAVGIGAAAAGVLVGVAKIGIEFESTFAGVRKTVELSEEGFAQLSENIRELGRTTPITTSKLNKIGELAGQLGVEGVDNLTKFIDTIARIAVSSDLTEDAAATSFARIANIMQEPIDNVDRMGASIIDVGNKFATSEPLIVDFAERIAGAGKIAGLTTADLFGISAAFSSVGVQAERGGTAVSKTLFKMTEAVTNGTDELATFADVAGLSMEEFSALFEKDAVGAFDAFILGLGEVGIEGVALLDELGLGDQRLLQSFISVAGAGGLMTDAIDTANVAWGENTALIEESNKRYETTESRLKIVLGNIKDVGVELWDAMKPALVAVLEAILPLIEKFAEFAEKNPKLILIMLGLAAVFGVIIAVALILAPIITAIIAIVGALGASGLLIVGVLLVVVNAFLLIVAVIAAVVAAGVWLYKNWDKVKAFMLKVWIAVLEAWSSARTKILEFVNKLVTGVKNYLSKVKLDIETALLNVWIGILNKWASARDKILEIAGKVKTGIINGFNAVVEFLTVTLPNAIITFFTQTLPNALIKFVTETLPNFFVSVVGAFLTGIGFILGIIIYGIPMLVDAIVTFFMELPGKIWGVLTRIVESFKTWIGGIVAYLVVAVPALIESIGTWLSALPGIVWDWLKKTWNKFVEWRDGVYAYLADKIVEIVTAIGEWISALPGIVWTWLVDTYEKFVTWGSDTYTSVSESVTKIINDVVAWFKALPGKIWNALSTLATKVKDRFVEMYTTVVDYLKTLPAKFLEWGTALAEAFVDGFSKIGEWVRDKVKEGLENAKAMLKGDSPPKEGPFKRIDVWGVNVGRAWAEGLIQGIGALPEMLTSPRLASAQVTGASSQPVSNYTTNSPAITVNIGMYAGSPMEKRQIAKDLSDALADYNIGEGVLNA